MHIYVASSWRNTYYPEVVQALREAGHEVYDFRNPPTGDPGFHWSDVDKDCMDWTPAEYQANLSHPLAERQFKNDIEAMTACDACVLVLPCGKSAHTEAGWFAGQGKKVYAFIPDKDSFENCGSNNRAHVAIEPELMYKLFTKVCISLEELIKCLLLTMPCPHNHIDCPCTKEGCPRHGKCCECVAHHKAHGTKLPACLRGIEWQK